MSEVPDKKRPSANKFLGLPLPALAVIGVVAAYLLYRKYKAGQASATTTPGSTTPTVGMPGYSSGDSGGGSGGGGGGGNPPPAASTGVTGTGIDYVGTGVTTTTTLPPDTSTISTSAPVVAAYSLPGIGDLPPGYIPPSSAFSYTGTGATGLNSTPAGYGTYQIPRKTFGL